jgi:predicted  nucleic acid-binding Zn-ribbon protein
MVKNNKELNKALIELKEHINFVEKNITLQNEKVKNQFKDLQKILEDIEP